jgi:hypothetical protein
MRRIGIYLRNVYHRLKGMPKKPQPKKPQTVVFQPNIDPDKRTSVKKLLIISGLVAGTAIPMTLKILEAMRSPKDPTIIITANSWHEAAKKTQAQFGFYLAEWIHLNDRCKNIKGKKSFRIEYEKITIIRDRTRVKNVKLMMVKKEIPWLTDCMGLITTKAKIGEVHGKGHIVRANMRTTDHYFPPGEVTEVLISGKIYYLFYLKIEMRNGKILPVAIQIKK